VHRNYFVDLGITTPKQVARSLTNYAKNHPELEFSTFMIPQVPGSIRRSHSIDGVLESVVKSKKYVVPLAVLNPELTAGFIVAYLTDGRFKAPKDAAVEMVPGEAVLKGDPAPEEPGTRRPLTSPAIVPEVAPTVAPTVVPAVVPTPTPTTPQ
jgi:hypothetical protein